MGAAPTTEGNGVLAKAKVVAGGKEYSFAPNSLGLFPRLGMGLEDTVAVILFDPIFKGLAISLMAGEVASLLLSRMAVPILYYMAHSRRPAASA